MADSKNVKAPVVEASAPSTPVVNAEAEALRAEVAALRAMLDASKPQMRIKTGDSGTVVITGPGLNKYGITQYASAMLAFLAYVGAPPTNPVTTYIRANKAKLAWQGEPPANL